MDIFKLLELGGEYSQLFDKISKYITMASIPILIIGIINCFLGYKLFRKMVAVVGAAAISVLLSAGYIAFKTWRGGDSSIAVALILAIIGIVIGGFLAYKLYFAGAFCMGFVTGMIGGVIVMRVVDQNSIMIGGVIAGLLMGLLAVDLYKHAIIAMTSINGGIISAISIAIILKKTEPEFILKTAVVMALIGIVVQYILTLIFPEKVSKDDSEGNKDSRKSKKPNKKKKSNKKKNNADKYKKAKKSKRTRRSKHTLKNWVNGVKEYFRVDDYDEDDEPEDDINVYEPVCKPMVENTYKPANEEKTENVLSDNTVRIDEVQRKVKESYRNVNEPLDNKGINRVIEKDKDIELIMDNNLELIELPRIDIDEVLFLKTEEKSEESKVDEDSVEALEKCIIDETMKRLI